MCSETWSIPLTQPSTQDWRHNHNFHNLLFVCFSDVNKYHLFVYSLKKWQKFINMGIKWKVLTWVLWIWILLIYFCVCLYFMNINKCKQKSFSEFTTQPEEYGYQIKAHDKKIANMMFYLLSYLHFVNINKYNWKAGFSQLFEVQIFWNLLDIFNLTQ